MGYKLASVSLKKSHLSIIYHFTTSFPMLTKRPRITVKKKVYELTHSTNLQRDRRWEKEERLRNKTRSILDEDIKAVRKREEEQDRLILKAFEIESSKDWSKKCQSTDEDWDYPVYPFEWSEILDLDEDQTEFN